MDYYPLYKFYKYRYLTLRGAGKGDVTSRSRKRDSKKKGEPYSSKHIRQQEALRERSQGQKQEVAPKSKDQKSKR